MRILGFVCAHHNKIQFFGYELANVLLVWYRTGDDRISPGSVNFEAMAALSFLFGSACIYAYHPERRPAGLFYGGIGLTAGGVFLTLAGFPLTGLSVALASLETVRGGLSALRSDLARTHRPASPLSRFTLGAGQCVFSVYIVPVSMLCRRFGRLGAFMNGRPFLTSALIKLPLRLEFVIKNALLGDLIGVWVGLSWMILGDGALAFNDPELHRSAHSFSRVTTRPETHPLTAPGGSTR